MTWLHTDLCAYEKYVSSVGWALAHQLFLGFVGINANLQNAGKLFSVSEFAIVQLSVSEAFVFAFLFKLLIFNGESVSDCLNSTCK